MSKLYAFYDFLPIDTTIEYLSHLLDETVTELQVYCLMMTGQLDTYRDDYITLQSIKVEQDKIIQFGKIHINKKVLLFPNIRQGISYQNDKNQVNYAYSIKDKQGKCYTAVDENHKIITPYQENDLQELSFSVNDLITLAKKANENNNKESISKPTTKKIPFQCLNPKNNVFQSYNVIYNNTQGKTADDLLANPNDGITISRKAILAVTCLLLTRLLNKKKEYNNHNLTQSTIIDAIEKDYPNIRSLSRENINRIFAEAKDVLSTIEKENSI